MDTLYTTDNQHQPHTSDPLEAQKISTLPPTTDPRSDHNLYEPTQEKVMQQGKNLEPDTSAFSETPVESNLDEAPVSPTPTEKKFWEKDSPSDSLEETTQPSNNSRENSDSTSTNIPNPTPSLSKGTSEKQVFLEGENPMNDKTIPENTTKARHTNPA